jgi:nuclear pore complex protein Nup54
MFGSTAQKPATSMFGNTTQPQTQPPAAGAPLFGSTLGLSTQAPQQQQQQQQQPQQQQSQFGLSTMVQPQGQPQEQSLSSSLWSPGRAITGGKPTHSLFSTSQFTH